MGFSVAFYHMGKFETFRGDDFALPGEHVRVVDPDWWSYFEALLIL